MKKHNSFVYATIPIVENNKVICYIASKCYLLQRMKFSADEDGMIKVYEVVPLYAKGDTNIWHRNEPHFDYDKHVLYSCLNDIYRSRICTNSLRVGEVFLTMEAAIKNKNQKNIELFNNSTSDIESKREWIRKLICYEELERIIEEKTSHFKIMKDSERLTYISIKSDKKEECDSSLYKMIEHGDYYDENYIIYSVSKEEYKKLQSMSVNESVDLSEFIHTPLLRHFANNNCYEVITNSGSNIYLNMSLHGMNQIIDGFYIPKINHFDRILFTTEDYYDLLESYKISESTPKYVQLVRK